MFDDAEVENIGMAVVGFVESRSRPLEDGLLLVRGSGDSHEATVGEHVFAGYLEISAGVVSGAKGAEGESHVGRVQIRPAGYAVLPTVRGDAFFAAGQWVVGEVVVAHQLDHGPHVADLSMISLENLSSGAQVVVEPTTIFLH